MTVDPRFFLIAEVLEDHKLRYGKGVGYVSDYWCACGLQIRTEESGRLHQSERIIAAIGDLVGCPFDCDQCRDEY